MRNAECVFDTDTFLIPAVVHENYHRAVLGGGVLTSRVKQIYHETLAMVADAISEGDIIDTALKYDSVTGYGMRAVMTTALPCRKLGSGLDRGYKLEFPHALLIKKKVLEYGPCCGMGMHNLCHKSQFVVEIDPMFRKIVCASLVSTQDIAQKLAVFRCPLDLWTQWADPNPPLRLQVKEMLALEHHSQGSKIKRRADEIKSNAKKHKK